jgi:hypothetical protein
MTALATDDRRGVAISFMKRASRDTFKVCAKTCEDMAAKVRSGDLPMDAETALMLVASMFTASAQRD